MISEATLHEDAIFEVTSTAPLTGTSTAYADSAEGAMQAVRHLRRDAGMMGTTARIENLITGQVWSGVK